jgi:predicted RNA-binding Zn-ribbon protein involved in translation (DUF1610 family)
MMSNGDQGSGGKKKIILGVVLVALAGSVGYQLLSEDESEIQPAKVQAFDFVQTWRCLDCQHTVKDNAGIGPRKCPKCGANSFYVSVDFSCRKHGVFPVALQYDDQARLKEIKIADGEWVPARKADGQTNQVCPKCGEHLAPAEAIPPRRPRQHE